MKIIFLDFDGVMDTAYYDHVLSKEGRLGHDQYGTVFDPNCIRNLRYIIENTGADIVVSSSWKYLMDYGDFLEMWKARNLPGFVTDVTPTPKGCRNRGDEIDAWIEDCPTECQYVIIDDLDAQNFNEHQIPRLLVVNPFYGIDEEIAERAIYLLNQSNKPFDCSDLRSFSINRWPEEMGTTHGVEHWDRVANFGRMLYQEGVDMDVILAFAYLHDSERKDNAMDTEHGKRAQPELPPFEFEKEKGKEESEEIFHPAFLNDIMEQNPAVEKLVKGFGLEMNTGELPF